MQDSSLVLPSHIGEEISLEASVRYNLNEPFTVWVMEQEVGDLFLYDPKDPHFLPIFVAHIKQGDLILGRATSEEKNYGLFFLSPRKTTLRKVSANTLLAEMAKDAVLKESIIKLLESYIHRIFSPFPHREERIEKVLKVGENTDLQPGEVAGPQKSFTPEEKEHIFWVEVLKGSCSFLDEASSLFFKETGTLYPITQSHWLRSEVESTLATFSTTQALEKPEFWKGIEALGYELFKTVVKQKNEELENALLRLQKKQTLEEDLIEQTLLSLGSVLNEEITVAHLHQGDLLFQTCDLIGRTMGLSFDNTPTKATTVDDEVIEICLNSNINFRRITLKGRWWKEAMQPLLGFFGPEQRPVALMPIKNNYEIVDLQEKKRLTLTPLLAKELSKRAYVFYRGFPQGEMTLFRIAKFSFEYNKQNFVWILFIAIVIGSLNLFLPFATRELFDKILFGTDISLFKQFVLGLLLVSFSTTIYTFCKNFLVLRIEGLSKSEMQTGLWLRVLQLPLSFFRKFTSGDLITRIMAYEKVRYETSSNLINLCVTSIFCLYYFAMLFAYNSKFATIGLIGLFVAALVFTLCIAIEVRLTKKSFALGTTIQGIVVQIISGIAKIRISGAEGRFFSLWGNVFSQKKKIDLKLLIVTAIERLVYRIFPVLMATLLFWVAIITFRNDPKVSSSINPSQSLGAFLGFYTAYALLIASALEVFQMAFSIWTVLPYWERSKVLVQSETEALPEKSAPIVLKGSIALEHVNFRYSPDGPLALDNVSLFAHPGEMIAIVGPSGCGKSTIVRLLLGFETPEQGEILFDDRSIFDYDIRQIRKQIGTVLQNEGMLGGSIYDIIAGSKVLSIEDIQKAIHMANLDDDLKALPMGLNTVMSTGGNTVSGGQRQRLYLARALAASPKILILDEATSALDNTSQNLIDKNLTELNITRVMIAHRLSTTRNADRIYVMDQGKIIEVGTYKELAAAKGLFAEMLKRQEL